MADLSRLFNFVAGTPAVADEVDQELDQLIARINDLPPEALQTVVAEALGLSQPGVVRRGKSIIPTEQADSGASYFLMPTPDRVQNVVLPTDGQIRVAYQATWRASVANAGRAAIFLGGNQLKVAPDFGTAPQTEAAGTAGAADVYRPLSSCPFGLVGSSAGVGSTYTGDVATGQAVGIAGDANSIRYEIGGIAQDVPLEVAAAGVCVIFAAAGTYTVSVQFKASSGSVTVKNRKLWVEAVAF